jgi:hypothetical protein
MDSGLEVMEHAESMLFGVLQDDVSEVVRKVDDVSSGTAGSLFLKELLDT